MPFALGNFHAFALGNCEGQVGLRFSHHHRRHLVYAAESEAHTCMCKTASEAACMVQRKIMAAMRSHRRTHPV